MVINLVQLVHKYFKLRIPSNKIRIMFKSLLKLIILKILNYLVTQTSNQIKLNLPRMIK